MEIRKMLHRRVPGVYFLRSFFCSVLKYIYIFKSCWPFLLIWCPKLPLMSENCYRQCTELSFGSNMTLPVSLYDWWTKMFMWVIQKLIRETLASSNPIAVCSQFSEKRVVGQFTLFTRISLAFRLIWSGTLTWPLVGLIVNFQMV